jgi:hypothetical protein
MTTPIRPRLRQRHNPGLDVEYLLKELDFQVAIETRARDRMENMVQYLLATIAAIIGAVLLVNKLQVNNVLLLSIASSLVFLFFCSAYYRSCRLRYITTYARVTRNNIRRSLVKLGINEADHLIEWEGDPSGFCDRMLKKLTALGILCTLLGGITAGLFLLLYFHIKEWPFYFTGSQLTLLIAGPLVLMASVWLLLRIVLQSQKAKSDEIIAKTEWLNEPKWKNLTDFDL